MSIRAATGYEPDFDIDLGRGSEAERDLRALLGEVIAGHRIEVKRDDQALNTGRVYLESAQKPRGAEEFKPSGLATTKAEIWAFRIGNVSLWAPTSAWRYVGNQYGSSVETTRGDNPTKGVAVSLDGLIRRLAEAPLDEARRSA
jgi:hypothetical protein